MSTMYEKIQNQIIDIIHKAEDGSMNYLDAAITLEEKRGYLEDSLEMIKEFKSKNSDDIKFLSDEYPDGYKGYVFEIRNGRKTYDFKVVPEWVEMNDKLKTLEKKYKSMLTAKINGSAYANVNEDGEELPLPEIKYARPSVIVKQKKR